jgi:transposase
MSYSIHLEENKLAELKDLKKGTKDSKVLRRYQCIHMLHNGMTKKVTAELLDVNIDTITDWVKLYNHSGLAGLSAFNYEGRRKSVLDSIQKELSNCIKTEMISTIAQLQDFIEKKFAIRIEHSWLSRYCKKNSIALIRKQD